MARKKVSVVDLNHTVRSLRAKLREDFTSPWENGYRAALRDVLEGALNTHREARRRAIDEAKGASA